MPRFGKKKKKVTHLHLGVIYRTEMYGKRLSEQLPQEINKQNPQVRPVRISLAYQLNKQLTHLPKLTFFQWYHPARGLHKLISGPEEVSSPISSSEQDQSLIQLTVVSLQN